MSDPFDSGTSGISLALDVPFPANVASGPGVKIDKATGTWMVSLDFPPLVDAGIPATPSAIYLAGYDTGLGIYEKLRLDNLIAGATGLDSRTPRGDADYNILIGDRYIGLTAALTAVRTWTLPPANTVPAGRLISIQDEAGGITGQNHLRILPTGADTIDGLAVYRLKARYGGLAFRSDGTSKWSIVYAWQVTSIADVAYTVQQGDITIAYTSISAARAVTLPAANAYPAGLRLTVIDYSGTCSVTNSITIGRAGADTINGATTQSITSAYGYMALLSDGVGKWTIVDAVPPVAPIPRGLLAGCQIQPTAGALTYTVTAGTAASDDATAMIALASSMQKTTSAWSLGAAAGGLDTGASAASTWYHVFLIRRPDTGVVDVLHSTSLSPTMPASYTQKRRIGSISTDGAGNWVGYSQNGDEFLLLTPASDYNAAPGASAVLTTMSTPAGVKTRALIRGFYADATALTVALISSPDVTDVNPATAGGYSICRNLTITGLGHLFSDLSIRTNTSRQIRVRGSAATGTVTIFTYGWVDDRGRFD